MSLYYTLIGNYFLMQVFLISDKEEQGQGHPEAYTNEEIK